MPRAMVVTSGVLVSNNNFPPVICRKCGKVVQIGEYYSYEGIRPKSFWHSPNSGCNQPVR